ncbi:MAG: 2-oxoacid:ferredoxin oxidoreductase subunit gamma [Firmicutes bacterium]|nr:2-oxoacid:ferredoxin oxidoreductase subunit gamma [Bacillota bacterium]
MVHEMIFAGFGGQGVMLMGQLVAYAAMSQGKHVSWFPSYGPEMRGGTANCAVVVSDEPVGSPVVDEPTALVTMNKPSFLKFLPSLQPGGVLVYNSSLVDLVPDRTDVVVLAVPATEIANELGEVRVANMVALGALLARTAVVEPEEVLRVLAKTLPKHRQDLLPLNRLALERGYGYIG